MVELLFNQKGRGIVTPFCRKNEKKTGGLAPGGWLKASGDHYQPPVDGDSKS